MTKQWGQLRLREEKKKKMFDIRGSLEEQDIKTRAREVTEVPCLEAFAQSN